MNTLTSAIPDLLRRFVPTPHTQTVDTGDIVVRLETNDIDIVSETQRLGTTLKDADSREVLLLKVVRDPDAPRDEGEVTVLSAPPLFTIYRGTGTVLALDCERREGVGFVAPDLSARYFVTSLVPLVLTLFKSNSPVATDEHHPHEA